MARPDVSKWSLDPSVLKKKNDRFNFDIRRLPSVEQGLIIDFITPFLRSNCGLKR